MSSEIVMNSGPIQFLTLFKLIFAMYKNDAQMVVTARFFKEGHITILLT